MSVEEFAKLLVEVAVCSADQSAEAIEEAMAAYRTLLADRDAAVLRAEQAEKLTEESQIGQAKTLSQYIAATNKWAASQERETQLTADLAAAREALRQVMEAVREAWFVMNAFGLEGNRVRLAWDRIEAIAATPPDGRSALSQLAEAEQWAKQWKAEVDSAVEEARDLLPQLAEKDAEIERLRGLIRDWAYPQAGTSRLDVFYALRREATLADTAPAEPTEPEHTCADPMYCYVCQGVKVILPVTRIDQPATPALPTTEAEL